MDNLTLTLGRPVVLTVVAPSLSVRLDTLTFIKFETDGNGRFTSIGTYRNLANAPAEGESDDDCDCCEEGYVEQLEAEVDALKQMLAEERSRSESFRLTLVDRIDLNDQLGKENQRLRDQVRTQSSTIKNLRDDLLEANAEGERLRQMIDGMAARIAAQSELLGKRAERGN